MRKATPTRYLSYARCSTEDQAVGDFTTIDSQFGKNRAYAEEKIARSVGVFVDEIPDAGKTGTNLNRPGWKKVLALARARKFDVLVITYMSRLGRGDVYYHAEQLLKECGVRIETVEEHFTPDVAGRMSKRVKILADGLYVDQVSEWTKTKQAGMVAQGYVLGGTRPYGYTSETVPGMADTVLPGGKVKPASKRRIPHEEERHHVVQAFALMRRHDNMGIVQRYLREVAPERQWKMDAVRRLLNNPVYIGKLKWKEHVNEGAHEPIVEREAWDQVQELIAARAD